MEIIDWKNKRVKVVLKSDGYFKGKYYKGIVLSQGEKYIVIRDLREAQVMINFDSVETIEEVKE